MPDKGWHRTFDDPIPLPDAGELRTLREAGNFIAKLPKREHDARAWRAAIEALMLLVDRSQVPNRSLLNISRRPVL